jgi:hypothetical protein
MIYNYSIGNESYINCYEKLEDYTTNQINQISNSFEINTDTSNLNENRTEILNNILKELYREETNDGLYKKLLESNLTFIFTSTANQKNNEDNNITIDLGK